jgi:hypothetical protein
MLILMSSSRRIGNAMALMLLTTPAFTALVAYL